MNISYLDITVVLYELERYTEKQTLLVLMILIVKLSSEQYKYLNQGVGHNLYALLMDSSFDPMRDDIDILGGGGAGHNSDKVKLPRDRANH